MPIFLGDPERIHLSFADPAAVEDEEARQPAFQRAAQAIEASEVPHEYAEVQRAAKG